MQSVLKNYGLTLLKLFAFVALALFTALPSLGITGL